MARRPTRKSRVNAMLAAGVDPILDGSTDAGSGMLDNGPEHIDDISQEIGREDIGQRPMGPAAHADDNPTDDEAGMTFEDFETVISKGIEAAENYIDTELSPDRAEASRYYRGDKFGNEVPGRSGVVMTEVRDAVLAQMPPLLRIFAGSTNAVEFSASSGTPQEQADQETEYVNHIINYDNPGFMILHSGFKDALVRRTGIFSWEWEEKEQITQERFSGLDDDAFAFLQMEAQENSDEDEMIRYDIEVTDQREDTARADTPPPMFSSLEPGDDGMPGAPPPAFIYDGIVKKIVIRKRVKVSVIPPEEFIMTPFASDNIDEFPLVGTRQRMTISDLVAIGHDEDEIREVLGGHGDTGSMEFNDEALDRNQNVGQDRIFDQGFGEVDPSSEEVKYCVMYALIDFDGDGIAERRKICTVGEANKIIYNEVYEDDMVPFSTICPDPEPHSPFGYSTADQTLDIQEVKSEMVRGVLDSLAQAIEQRFGVMDTKVNIDDLLSGSTYVRMKDPQALFPMSQTFIGMNAMPVLEYIDAIKQRRTGVNPASAAGLDVDALQSTAKEAVASVVDASQERVEMIARIFAETGIKRLMRGIRNLVVRHQDKKRVLRLRGIWRTIDPRSWNADLDMTVNVGTGRAVGAKRLAGLQMIIARQDMVYQNYGPNNPIVGLKEIYYANAEFIRELGFNDPDRFIKPVTDEVEEQLKASAAQAAAKPSPQELLAQASAAETAAKLKIAGDREATARLKLMTDDDRQREKAEMELYTKVAEIAGKFGLELNAQEIQERVRQDNAATDLANSVTEQENAERTAAAQPPAQPQGNGQ